MSRKKKAREPLLPEWPHRVDVSEIGDSPVRVRIAATPAQCVDLARRLRVETLEDVHADMMLTREPGGHKIYVKGTVSGAVTQLCAVTLAPLSSIVTDEFESCFADHEQVVNLNKARRERAGVAIDSELPVMDEENDPEPLRDGCIDVGELATQYLSLAIDPFARVSRESGEENPASLLPVNNPFAALKNWRSDRGD